VLDESDGPDGMPLPISGWRLCQRVQRNGRAVIEISDDTGDLIGLITSTSLSILSVDAAWRGRGQQVDGTRQWWALAIGHASAADEDPVVTFIRRVGPHGIPRRTVVRTSRLQGLWIAAAPGLHTAVICRQGPQHRIRRLAPVPRLHADA
jgi:hypothetical protein